MVKPELDGTIDYYGLLDVPLHADYEVIKKSYKKRGSSQSMFRC